MGIYKGNTVLIISKQIHTLLPIVYSTSSLMIDTERLSENFAKEKGGNVTWRQHGTKINQYHF